MKAQATLEFMLVFLANIVFITLLIAGMSLAKDHAEEQSDVLAHTVRMEGIARTLEAHSSIGMIMIFDIDDEASRIEGDRVETDYMNRTIVVEGIFRNEGPRIEPV